MTKIKICGITNLEDALGAIELGADALGFVFAPSPRQITLDKAKEIIEKLPPFVAAVGVFVDEKPGWVMRVAAQCRLDWVQLHGDEPPQYCDELGLKIIKVFKKEIQEGYNVSGILIDTKEKDWELAVEAKKYGKPIILAGGLTPENVVEAIRMVNPYGVDVSRGVESHPGKKDYRKMEEFIDAAR